MKKKVLFAAHTRTMKSKNLGRDKTKKEKLQPLSFICAALNKCKSDFQQAEHKTRHSKCCCNLETQEKKTQN